MSRTVASMKHARERRDHDRLLSLQTEFARRGFDLQPLWEGRLLVQRWGLYRVLDDLNDAKRFIARVGA